jgi:hypothetical protein
MAAMNRSRFTKYATLTLLIVFVAATLAGLVVVTMLHFAPVATSAHWRSPSHDFIVGLQSMSTCDTHEVYDCVKVCARGIYQVSRGRYLKLVLAVSAQQKGLLARAAEWSAGGH